MKLIRLGDTKRAMNEMDENNDMESKSKGKRPPNAFILYCLERRQEVRVQNPDLPNLEVTKRLSEQWKSLNEVGRRPYKERAKALQAEFKKSNPKYGYTKARQRRNTREMLLQQNSYQGGMTPSVQMTAVQLIQAIQAMAHSSAEQSRTLPSFEVSPVEITEV